MSHSVKKMLFLLEVLSLLLLTGVLAWADPVSPAAISVAETDHGRVQVQQEEAESSKARITLTPEDGYMVDSITLKTNSGTEVPVSSANIRKTNEQTGEVSCLFTCEIPDQESILTVTFRRARITLSVEELAMSAGETGTVSATIEYSDGEVNTRKKVYRQNMVYASSAPDVVSVDPATGKLTAEKMGYARITAIPYYGNSGSEAFFYVIVDGDQDEVVGTIQVNAYFDEEYCVKKLAEGDVVPGHSFLIFRNTSGKPISIPTSNLSKCFIPTEAYYDAVKNYDGEGYDPLTYYYVTSGEDYNDDNLEARENYVNSLFTRYERGEVESYTIDPNDIATFGNTGEYLDGESILNEFISSDFAETLERMGLTSDLNQIIERFISGKINSDTLVDSLLSLAEEIGYDFSNGYNPFNYEYRVGGVCLNYELYCQAFHRDYSSAAAIRTDITRIQLMALLDYYQYHNSFGSLNNNCTTAASGAWNLITAAHPEYHLEANAGGYTSAISAPVFLRNNILAASVSLAGDGNLTFFHGIGVIRPDLMSVPGTFGGKEIKPLFGSINTRFLKFLNLRTIFSLLFRK